MPRQLPSLKRLPVLDVRELRLFVAITLIAAL
jgi:hypothetical protein